MKKLIGCCALMVAVSPTACGGLNTMVPYGALPRITGKGEEPKKSGEAQKNDEPEYVQGRKACAVEAEERGDSSSGYAVGGWFMGAATLGLATTPALLVQQDEPSKSDKILAPALLASSVVTGALAYVFFERSNAHANAAATSQTAVGGEDDKEAYETCVKARSLVYSSRKEMNELATSKLLDKPSERARSNAALGNWFLAANELENAKSALQAATAADNVAAVTLETATARDNAAPNNETKSALTEAKVKKAETAKFLELAQKRVTDAESGFTKAETGLTN
jgi:hypothetical protein